jgi:hypothetical protein
MDKTGLTTVERVDRGNWGNHNWHFTEGDIRTAFRRIHQPDNSYVIFKSVANQEAVDLLMKYKGTRKNMKDPWQLELRAENDDLEVVPGASDRDNPLCFTTQLLERYHSAIDILASESIWEQNFSHYSMVARTGIPDEDYNDIFWPEIYMVNEARADELQGIIMDLSKAASLAFLKKQESPQNYYMGEIQLLHDQKIPPLIIQEPQLTFGAAELGQYIDFFAQMSESYSWSGRSHDVD